MCLHHISQSCRGSTEAVLIDLFILTTCPKRHINQHLMTRLYLYFITLSILLLCFLYLCPNSCFFLGQI